MVTLALDHAVAELVARKGALSPQLNRQFLVNSPPDWCLSLSIIISYQ
jgi:hypothetical protein